MSKCELGLKFCEVFVDTTREEVSTVGRMYDALQAIDRVIEERGLDPFVTKGAIGMKAGFFLVTILPTTPDDPARLEALQKAAADVLGQSLRF